jgi:ankyrin repeat protein
VLHPDYRESIELLLDAGANAHAVFVVAEDGSQMTLLMAACTARSSVEPLRILLQHGANACLSAPSSGLTALHIAVRHGSIDQCKLLVEIDRRTLEVRTGRGWSPVHCAVLAEQPAVLELLHTCHGADLSTVDDRGTTLLHAAALAQRESQPLLQYLLRCELDINAVDTSGQTPLHAAAFEGHAAAVQTLLEHGADPCITDA